MALPKGIELLPITSWENRHQNFTQKLTKDASFKIRNDHSLSKSSEKYKATTKNIQWLIGHAIKNKIRLRAMVADGLFLKLQFPKEELLTLNHYVFLFLFLNHM